MPTLPEARIGDPVRHLSLTVFPLYAEPQPAVDYLLSDEALAEGDVTVQEVTEGGSVPDLLVDNQADHLVLFLEGEELRGAKQNRVLNTSVLVAAKSKTVVPVSCVERGRWRYHSPTFGHSGSHSSSKMRYVLKKSVSHSSREGQGHTSDQGEVWKEVDRQMASFGAASPTAAMADTYESRKEQLSAFTEQLKYVEGAVGLAAAVGDRVVSVDLFDKPATCRKVWERLLSGLIMDSLEAGATEVLPARADVETLLGALRAAPWQPAPPVGVGEELRAEMEGDRHASALLYGGTVIHGSLVVAG
jgi:hypothetical protein